VIWAQNALGLTPNQEYYRNDATKTDALVYTRAQLNQRNPWKYYVDMQLRAVNYAFEGLDENGNTLERSVDHLFFSPRVGVQYSKNPASKWYGFLGYGNKEPNRDDFTESPAGADPEPERMINLELGKEGRGGRYAYNINGYGMFYRNQLIPTGELNDVGAAVRVNVPNSYRIGVELQGEYALSSQWTISGNATVSQNRVAKFTQFIDDYDENFEYIGQRALFFENTPLALSPSFIGQTEINYRPFDATSLSIFYKYISEQHLDNTGSETAVLDGYGSLDISASHTLNILGTQLRLQGTVYNVLNSLNETFGWTYPYYFPGENSGDFTRRDGQGFYRDMGLYPQATRYALFSAVFTIQ